MVAADLVVSDKRKRAGLDVYHAGMQHGAFLRPLGNTIYWLPPLIMNQDELALLEQMTRDAIVVGLNK